MFTVQIITITCDNPDELKAKVEAEQQQKKPKPMPAVRFVPDQTRLYYRRRRKKSLRRRIVHRIKQVLRPLTSLLPGPRIRGFLAGLFTLALILPAPVYATISIGSFAITQDSFGFTMSGIGTSLNPLLLTPPATNNGNGSLTVEAPYTGRGNVRADLTINGFDMNSGGQFVFDIFRTDANTQNNQIQILQNVGNPLTGPLSNYNNMFSGSNGVVLPNNGKIIISFEFESGADWHSSSPFRLTFSPF